MASSTVDRAAFMDLVLSKEGCPYVWGGKGFAQWTRTGLQVHGFADAQNHPLECFDCAGLITSCLHTLGGQDWRAARGAHDLATLLPKLSAEESINPLPGSVACYGHEDEAGLTRISHVMLIVGDGQVFGACQGGSDTLTPEIAKKQGARVRYRPRIRYRADFRWLVHLPLSD